MTIRAEPSSYAFNFYAYFQKHPEHAVAIAKQGRVKLLTVLTWRRCPSWMVDLTSRVTGIAPQVFRPDLADQFAAEAAEAVEAATPPAPQQSLAA